MKAVKLMSCKRRNNVGGDFDNNNFKVKVHSYVDGEDSAEGSVGVLLIFLMMQKIEMTINAT
jgi:hypothetical protein